MADHKKHHFVPKFYMKNFANSEGLFYVYNIKTTKSCGLVPYKAQCYRDYFYGKDLSFENELAKKEQKWSLVIEKILSSDTLNEQDIYALKEFALYQRQRTEIEFNHNKKTYIDSSVEYVKTAFYHKKIPYDEVFCKKAIEEHAKTNFDKLYLIHDLDKMINLIGDLKCQIIEFKTSEQLVASDSPIIMINPFTPHTGTGLACAGLVIMFPISNTKIVVIYDDVMYNNSFSSMYHCSTNEKDVMILNNLQYISANKILFSHSDFLTFQINDSLKKNRIDSQNSSKIQTLGPEGHKLVMNSPRITIFDGELSFTKLPRKMKRIPYICREGFWRYDLDGRWEEKLGLKWTVLNKLYHNSDVIDDTKTSKKECKLGCNRMYVEAKKYWQRKGSPTNRDFEKVLKEIESACNN